MLIENGAYRKSGEQGKKEKEENDQAEYQKEKSQGKENAVTNDDAHAP